MIKINNKILDEKTTIKEQDVDKNNLINNENDSNNPYQKIITQAYVHFEKANEENKNGLLYLKKLNKVLSKLNNSNTKNKKNTVVVKKQTGFSELRIVPEELKELLGINENILARTEITKKVYKYIDDNKLKYPNNKRIIRVDDKLAKALKLSKDEIEKINNSQEQKDANGLNFFNIQTWLAKLYVVDKNDQIDQINQLKTMDIPSKNISNTNITDSTDSINNNIILNDDLVILKKNKSLKTKKK